MTVTRLTIPPTGMTQTVPSLDGFGTGYVLGIEPTAWQTLAFNDSAWDVIQRQHGAVVGPPFTSTQWIVDSTIQGVQPVGKTWLYRRTITLPGAFIVSAVLHIVTDNITLGFWINGSLVSGITQGTYTLSTSLFRPGQVNLMAVKCQNDASGGPTSLDYLLTLTYRPGLCRFTTPPGLLTKCIHHT